MTNQRKLHQKTFDIVSSYAANTYLVMYYCLTDLCHQSVALNWWYHHGLITYQ